METKRKERLLSPLVRLVQLNSPFYPWLIAMLAATSLDGASKILTGWAFSHLVDSTIGKSVAEFGRFALYVACIQVVSIGIAALSRYASGRYANLCVRNIRDQLGRKFTRVTLPWLEKRRSGDLLSILGNDLGQISAFYEEHMRLFIGDWVTFCLALIYMITLNPWLTLATVAYIPVGGIVTTLAGRSVQKLAEEQNGALGVANAIAQDGISGHAEVKAFNLRSWLSARYAGALHGWTKAGLRSANAQAAVNAASILNTILPFLLMMCLGLRFVLQGRMTGGELVAFMFVSNAIVNPLMALTWRTAELRRAAGASARLAETLNAPEERRGGGDPGIEASKPLLSFRGIHFSYERGDGGGDSALQAVFNGLDLDIAAGETVAIVGQSGSGKSTLLKLAAGLYQPDAGRVLFGGRDLADWNLEALRGHMAFVEQDTYLFPGSIGENIACGAQDDGEGVAGAARLAQLDEFLSSLPDGLDTPVGERGSRLSGGQRQRVAIARAALRDARLLLMDEPTSALDSTTEKEIQRELAALARGRTALIVTHRLSMALCADRIVVLHEGAVAEQGTHAELMAARGLYWALYSRQMKAEGGGAA